MIVPALALSALAAGLIAWVPVAGFWWRMALGSAILMPLSFLAAGRQLLPLLRPSWRHAITGMITGMRRFMRPAITLPAAGPASLRAGPRKKIWNAIIPTHSAPKNTWLNRSTSVSTSRSPGVFGRRRI